ncbi:hypothetical protein N7448_001345 [Penicillium atrosanguineum]|nr:hypothetical protein N7526_004997 [Penicillium atrosanguineum]KAJ5149767.1 hypothetical protein N7448_001345 [Penicillium atrosanguineum]
MSANAETPNAWEDDWESQADTLATDPSIEPEKKVSSKITKAQRRAQQAEFNRQLWAEADTPQTFHYVEARSEVVPLKQDIKPAVTLLSRKPQIATRRSTARGVNGATAGLGQLCLDGEEDDSDDESKSRQPTFEERQAIALKAREEKQRKYEEVRERLFGSPSATTSGTSSPGSTTPPRQNSSGDGRGKGKGRGGRDYQKRDSSAASNKSSRHLYDPSTSTKSSGPQLQRRERQGGQSGSEKPPAPQQPTRSPRGPDGSGRGGFGFANRGARTG